jgi:hypothetical protein
MVDLAWPEYRGKPITREEYLAAEAEVTLQALTDSGQFPFEYRASRSAKTVVVLCREFGVEEPTFREGLRYCGLLLVTLADHLPKDS